MSPQEKALADSLSQHQKTSAAYDHPWLRNPLAIRHWQHFFIGDAGAWCSVGHQGVRTSRRENPDSFELYFVPAGTVLRELLERAGVGVPVDYGYAYIHGLLAPLLGGEEPKMIPPLHSPGGRVAEGWAMMLGHMLTSYPGPARRVALLRRFAADPELRDAAVAVLLISGRPGLVALTRRVRCA